MSTPTTLKLQIAVPSTDGNGGAETIYTLTLSLLVEGDCESDIKVTPILTTDSDSLTGVLPAGDVPLLPDPPTN